MNKLEGIASSRSGKALPRVAAVLLLLGLVAGLLWFFLRPLLDPLSLPSSQWREFLRRYVSPEGRVIDTGNGNISHSEGQGYGLILAEAFNDKRSFERILTWTRSELQVREDTLFAWKWEPDGAGGGVATDKNNASDGDLLIAWALWRASERWGNEDYPRLAAQILSDLRQTCFVQTRAGLQMLPGEYGFNDTEGSVILNPSYAVFPAFIELARFTLGDEMRALNRGGNVLCSKARFGDVGLTADWVVLTGKELSLPPPEKFPSVFGYNAIRVPLHAAWSDRNSPLLAPYASFWSALPEGTPMPAEVFLPSGEFGPHPALPGALAVRDFTEACVQKRPFFPRDVAPILPDEAYYSAALKLLTMVAARDSAKKPAVVSSAP
jgi:endoglucanase